MGLNKALHKFVGQAKTQDGYWVEEAKLDFALVLEARRKALGLKYAALAAKLGTSPAYLSKIFRGDANLTIESMVKLARATGGELSIRISDGASIAGSWGKVASDVRGSETPLSTKNTATVYSFAGYVTKNEQMDNKLAA